jgi:diguanylate cyclase (GGDEF)-like protein/PAS domain S-box-containing protein
MAEGDSNSLCAAPAPFDQRSEARLLSELPDAVIVIDADGRLRWFNRSAEAMFGRSMSDLIGLPGLDLVHPEDLEFALLAMDSVQSKHVGTPIELRLRSVGGWRLVELVGSPIPWSEPGAVVLALRDLTERRRFELAHDQDARLRSLVQNSAALTMLVSRDGVVESVSGALPRLLGQDPELVEGRPLSDLVSVADRSVLTLALRRAEAGATAANPVTTSLGLIRRGSDQTVPFELSIVNLTDDPTIGGFVVSGHDITTRTVAEHEQRKAVSLLTATLEATADGILVIDEAGLPASFNQQFAVMWRLPASLAGARGDESVVAFMRDQLVRPDQLEVDHGDVVGRGGEESFDVLELTDGRVFERCVKLQRVDRDVVGRVWSFRDMTDRKRLEDRLSYQAFHDSLTGLGNRALFRDRLEHAVARIRRTGGNLAVLFLDVDNFKTVNDSLGHSVGDALLESMAGVLVGCLRRADTAARLGGDEFGVVIEEFKHPSEIFELVDRTIAALCRPMPVNGEEVSTTVSVGIAFDAPGDTSDDLLCKADLAMYSAKEGGGNRFAAFEASMLAAVGSS